MATTEKSRRKLHRKIPRKGKTTIKTTKEKVNNILDAWIALNGKMAWKKSDALLAKAMGLIFGQPVQRWMHLFNKTFAKRLPASPIMVNDDGDLVNTMFWCVPGEPRYVMVVIDDLSAELHGWCLNDLRFLPNHIEEWLESSEIKIQKLILQTDGERLPPCWGPVPKASNEDWEQFFESMLKAGVTPRELSVHLPKDGDISALLSVLKQHHSTFIIKRPLVEIFNGTIKATVLMTLQEEFNNQFSIWRKFCLLGSILIVWFLLAKLVFFNSVFCIGNTLSFRSMLGIGGNLIIASTIGTVICVIGLPGVLVAASFIGALMAFARNITFFPYILSTILFASIVSMDGTLIFNLGFFDQVDGIVKAWAIGTYAAAWGNDSVARVVSERVIAGEDYKGSSSIISYIEYPLDVFNVAVVFTLAGFFGVSAGMRGETRGIYLLWKEYAAFIIGIICGNLYGCIKNVITNAIYSLGAYFHIIPAAMFCVSFLLILKGAHISYDNGVTRFFAHKRYPMFAMKFCAPFMLSALNLTDYTTARHFTLPLDTSSVLEIIGVACVMGATGALGFAFGDIYLTQNKHEAYKICSVIFLSGAIGAGTGIVGWDSTAGIIYFILGNIFITFLISKFPFKTSIALLMKPNILYHKRSASEMIQWLQKMGDVCDPAWIIDTGRTSEESADFDIQHYTLSRNDKEQHQSNSSPCTMDEDDDMSRDRDTHAQYRDTPAQVNIVQTLDERPGFTYSDFYRVPQTVFRGEPFVLEIQLRAGASTNIIWKHNDEILTSNKHCQIQRTQSTIKLVIPNTVHADEGIYVAHAENDYGFFQSTFRLLVFDKDSKVLPHEKTGPVPADHYGVKVTSKDTAQLTHPKSSVVLTIPEGAVPEGMTLTISQQVLTDLGSFKHLLDTDHQFITPVVKFHVDQEIEFCKPLKIEMRHCLNGGIDKIKAYHTSGSRITCIPKSTHRGDLFFTVTERTVIISTQHLCKFYCASHERDCHFITAVLLFMSTENIQNQTAVCLRPIFCAACAILPDFESNIKNIIDRDMREIKRREWPLPFKLTSLSISKATLNSTTESGFSFLRSDKNVQERSFNNAFTHGMMPFKDLADFNFFIPRASCLAGSISISIVETSTNAVCTEDIEFIKDTTMQKDSEEGNRTARQASWKTHKKMEYKTSDTYDPQLIELIERYGELFRSAFEMKCPEVSKTICYEDIEAYMTSWNILSGAQLRRIQEATNTSIEKVICICKELGNRPDVERILFAKALIESDQLHCLKAILPGNDIKAIRDISLERCLEIRRESLPSKTS